MFYRHLDDNIKTALSIPQFAAELFELTDKNRGYLKTWLPWLDAVKKPGDTEAFLSLQLKRFSAGEALHLTIFHQDRIAGVLGYNQIDPVNGTGHIGYWLGREYTGRGIMTSAVRDLIGLGFENWPLQRVEIRCAVENHKSRAIPERLGFKNEGTIRRAEKVYDTYNDHIVYGLLKEDFS